MYFFFFFQAEDGIRDDLVTGVQTCALPILSDTVDLGSENVVHDDGNSRSTDTKSRVIQRLGNTLGQTLRSFPTASFTKRGERTDNPKHRSEQPHQGCDRTDRRKEYQVLFQHR